MLSIQPVSVTSPRVRNVQFGNRNAFTIETPEDEAYSEKTKFYEKQKQEFENIVNDERTPEILKKMGKAFKVVSEALFNGWLVAWGASKGAKFVKSSVASGMNSKMAAEAKSLIKPLIRGFSNVAGAVAGGAARVAEHVKASSAYTNLTEKVTKFTEKMDNHKYGQYLMSGLRLIGEGAKAVFNFIAKPFEKFAEKIKGADFNTAYDKAAKVTSTTLGVGAGAASAYDEAVHPETQKMHDEVDDEEVNNDKKEFDDEVQRHLDELDGEDE